MLETMEKRNEEMIAESQSLQNTVTNLRLENEGLRENHEARVTALENDLSALRRELEEKVMEAESNSWQQEERERQGDEERQNLESRVEKLMRVSNTVYRQKINVILNMLFICQSVCVCICRSVET